MAGACWLSRRQKVFEIWHGVAPDTAPLLQRGRDMWRYWLKPYIYSLVAIFVVFQMWCVAWLALYGVGLHPFTAFMKAEQMRLIPAKGQFLLERDWRSYSEISDNLKKPW